jgi:hypothetical protein
MRLAEPDFQQASNATIRQLGNPRLELFRR